LGKNFGTTISPWIVTLDALEQVRVPQPVQDPIPANDSYDIALEVHLKRMF
jgi:fumarylacetoacetase